MKQRTQVLLNNFTSWLSYWQDTLMLIAELSERGDLVIQQYRASSGAKGTYSDPVARHYSKIDSARKTAEFALGYIRPALDEYLALKNSDVEEEREMFLVFERHFCGKESIEAIARDLSASERTMYRRKVELMRRVERRQEKNGRKPAESCYNA